MALVNASPRSRRPRLWLTVGGLVLLAILTYLAVVRWDRSALEQRGLDLMQQGDFAQAAEILQRASARYTNDARLPYLAAVALRRAGQDGQFELQLRRAERLGLSGELVQLQRLLSRTQHGLGDAASDAALKNLCLQGQDDFTAEQIYEAMTRGYLSTYQTSAAHATLEFWIQWKPNSPPPRILRAELYEQGDHLTLAEADYRAILAAHPNHFEAMLRLARLLYVGYQHAEALDLLTRCETLRPGDPRVAVTAAEVQYSYGGDSGDIERTLQRILKHELDPELRMRAWRVLSDIYLDSKNYQQVVDLLDDAAEQRSLDLPCYQALIRAYLATGRKDRAEHFIQLQQRLVKLSDEAIELDRQIRGSPNDPDLRFRRGQISLDVGRSQDAMTWWYTALLVDPLHQRSHEALAKSFLAKGDAQKAAQHQAAAIRSGQRTFERAWEHYSTEDFQFVREQIPEIARYEEYQPHAELLRIALEVHQAQRKLDPGCVSKLQQLLNYPSLQEKTLTVLGAALFQLGRFGPAEEAFGQVLRMDPRSIPAHRWLVAMYKDVRDLERLNYHCRQWAALDPTDFRPYRLLGLEDKSRAVFDPAVSSYQKALARNPPPHVRQQIILELAECQLELSQPDAGIETLRQADASVAGDVLLSRCYWALNREAEARQLVDDCLRREPGNRSGNLLRADIAIKDKDFELAAQCLNRLLEEHPFDHAGWFKLSQVSNALKQFDKAREYGAKSRQLQSAESEYQTAMERALLEPENLELRLEMAARARQIGRPDLAEEWERAANLLKTLPADRGKQPASAEVQSAPSGEIPLIEPKIKPAASALKSGGQ